MQKVLFLTFVTLFFCGNSFSQKTQYQKDFQSEKIYSSLKEAMQNPKEVKRLHLKKKKLRAFPEEVFQMTNLKELILSKNRIKAIPTQIDELVNLEVLDCSNNKIASISDDIGSLENLTHLILNRNDISYLPASIGNLKKIEYIDLWSNLIIELPPEIAKLKDILKELDLRVIYMSQTHQNNIKDLLPNTIIHFSRTCNCD
ncbi:MAG: leucine-rich repeat domain-containing protein [Bacteroidales bacterium]|nr:leucine-rich repeat domain-containing protein [Bacteroidales bacterium]